MELGHDAVGAAPVSGAATLYVFTGTVAATLTAVTGAASASLGVAGGAIVFRPRVPRAAVIAALARRTNSRSLDGR